jgi:hypothetical protein
MSRVIVPQRRPTSDVPYHHDRAPGQKYLLLDRSVSNDTPMYVALRRIDGVPPGQPRWLDPHAHNCNSFYVFLGDEEDLDGLAGEVEIGGVTFEVRSPSAVLIPPFVLHRYWLESGSGWYLQITLAPTYEESLAERGDWRSDTDAQSLNTPVEAAGARLRLIDDRLFDTPGVAVDVAEAPVPPDGGGQGFALHVVVSRRAAPASVSLTGGDGAPLATPIAVLATLGEPQLEPVSGRPLVVRIRPTDRPGG